jgi:hypothetical protein
MAARRIGINPNLILSDRLGCKPIGPAFRPDSSLSQRLLAHNFRHGVHRQQTLLEVCVLLNLEVILILVGEVRRPPKPRVRNRNVVRLGNSKNTFPIPWIVLPCAGLVATAQENYSENGNESTHENRSTRILAVAQIQPSPNRVSITFLIQRPSFLGNESRPVLRSRTKTTVT